ncbi:MAG: 4Fe-4S dicluster domain-containing protein [Pseudomonadota bacterium]
MSKTEFSPDPKIKELYPEEFESGNDLNGLGETEARPASPFFWHPAGKNPFIELTQYVGGQFFAAAETFAELGSQDPEKIGPKSVEQAPEKIEKSPEAWTKEIEEFVLANEGDVVGFTDLDPMFVFDSYEIDQPRLVMIGVQQDYENVKHAPASFENQTASVEMAKQYNRGLRVARRLSNHLRAQGYSAKPYGGPFASALNMVPAAIAAGLGELGKHGSLINRTLGANFRLAAVATDAPFDTYKPDVFGADDFCTNCQICVKACPPDAISDEKQMVRGVEKWYVDFDACIPYIKETIGCGICITVCPWSRPQVGPNLLKKMLKKRGEEV